MGRREDSHKTKTKKTKKKTTFAEPETNLYEEVKEEKKKSKSLGKKRRDREKGSGIEADEVDQYNVESEAYNAEEAVREKNKSKLLGKKKRKNGRTEKSEIAQVDECCNEVDNGFEELSAQVEGEMKDSKSRKKRRKNEKNKVGIDKVAVLHNKGEEGSKGKKGRSNKARNAQRDHPSPRKEEKSLEKRDPEQNEVYEISSGDEDCSTGMKKWITEYHQCRPGLKILQQRIDDFITDYEAKEEQARKEREALAAEGGWTVVVHHKGRKKTTDTETGITVGSVAQAAVLENMSKKKNKEVGVDFYRFQKREAQRNEIMALQSKFEQDKKRIQQMRAARKFRPY